MFNRNRAIIGGLAIAVCLSLLAAVFSPIAQPQGATGSPQPSPGTPFASPVASPAGSPVSTADCGLASEPIEVTVELTDQGFRPCYIQTTSFHSLTITLINTGSRDHGFTITEFGIDELLAPGETATVVLRNPQGLEADVEYVSNAPGDEGMTGILTLYV